MKAQLSGRLRWAGLAMLPREKADTLLLLAGAVMVLAPHAAHVPLWTSLVAGSTLLWRAVVTLRGTRMPPLALLVPVAMAAMGGVYATYHTLLGREAGVAMLVLLLAFKMLEMHARRDLFIVLFLSIFLVMTHFFYSQSMASALMMVAAVIVLLTTQLTFQYTGVVPPLARRAAAAATMLALGAPLALVMFIVFPRIQGPLWGLPGDAGSARTGLSDQMAPGNVSSLAQSEEAAFRVQFFDPAPAQAQLYWRGIVLGDFDGRTWTRVKPAAGAGQLPAALAISLAGAPIRYQVTLEPSNSRWLFTLELARQVPQIEGNPGRMSAELEMTARFPIEQRVRYHAASHPAFSLQADEQAANLQQWLALPAGFNPRSLRFARALAGEPALRIKAVLARFAREDFRYTLEPPLLGVDAVDEFLFDSKAGFCEHYAGAFAFLMRAAGVPARVVTGYQGGQTNPVDGVMTVRQSDAHAWTEVWLAGRGWVRIDPTAAVAPDRIQKNLARALLRRAPFGIEGLRDLVNFDADGNWWIAQARFRLGALNNAWNQWVLNYTPQQQRSLLAALRFESIGWRTGAAFAAIVLAAALAGALHRRAMGDPVDALYSRLCAQLAQSGLARAPHEGPHAYARRVKASGLSSTRLSAATRFLQLYSAYKYGAPAPDARLLPTLKKLLNESR